MGQQHKHIDVIVGHSLGGIVAKIVAYKLYTEQERTGNKRQLGCITFNSPCVSNYVGRLYETVDTNYLRVESICHPWDMIAAAQSVTGFENMKIGNKLFGLVTKQLGIKGKLADSKSYVFNKHVIDLANQETGEYNFKLLVDTEAQKLQKEVDEVIKTNSKSFFAQTRSDLNLGLCTFLELKFKHFNLKKMGQEFAKLSVWEQMIKTAETMNDTGLLFGLRGVAFKNAGCLNPIQIISLIKLGKIAAAKFSFCHAMGVMKLLVKKDGFLNNTVPYIHRPETGNK